MIKEIVKSTVTPVSSVRDKQQCSKHTEALDGYVTNLHEISQIAGQSMPPTPYDNSNYFLKCSHLLLGMLV